MGPRSLVVGIGMLMLGVMVKLEPVAHGVGVDVLDMDRDMDMVVLLLDVVWFATFRSVYQTVVVEVVVALTVLL